MDRIFRLIGFAMIALLALVLLAGCSGDGNADLSRLRREQAATQATPQPTAAPDVVYQQVEKLATVIVEKTVRETVEVPVDRPVEVTREVTVYIEATPEIANFAPTVRPTNGVTGYADTSVCDMSQPQPTPRVGDVDRVIGCVSAWETAVVASHGGK